MSESQDRKRLSRCAYKMYVGCRDSVRYGVELEKMRVKLGSAEKLVVWLEEKAFPSRVARAVYKVRTAKGDEGRG
jgi:hypothetical protein